MTADAARGPFRPAFRVTENGFTARKKWFLLNPLLAPVEQRKSENLPAGSCMPIGLTARGNIVFPWECRELIEKQRGPVSEDIQNPPKDSASKEPAKEAASQDARPEPVVVAPE